MSTALLERTDLSVINVGVDTFLRSVVEAGGQALQLEWQPPGSGDAELAWALARLAGDASDQPPSGELSEWRSNLLRTWNGFVDHFITIRRRDGQVEALLSPQQDWYLKENLKTRLLQAQLAVFREQPPIYEDNLNKADKWIEQYFDANDATTQYMHSEIARLLEQPLAVDLPKQFQSQATLESLVQQRLQRLLKP